MHIGYAIIKEELEAIYILCRATILRGNDTPYLALCRRYLIASAPYSFRIIKDGILQRDEVTSAFTLARRRNILQGNSIDSRSMEDVVEIVPLRVIYGGAVARSTP